MNISVNKWTWPIACAMRTNGLGRKLEPSRSVCASRTSPNNRRGITRLSRRNIGQKLRFRFPKKTNMSIHRHHASTRSARSFRHPWRSMHKQSRSVGWQSDQRIAPTVTYLRSWILQFKHSRAAGSVRDSARNDKSGLENLNDLTALVHRPAEKDYGAAIGSRARRRDLDDFALNM
jgi:hypothetical protein